MIRISIRCRPESKKKGQEKHMEARARAAESEVDGLDERLRKAKE